MKKYLTILTALLLSLCFILVGCVNPQPVEHTVSSNGGSVVMVDEYVYFANTFVDYSTLSGNDNQESNVQYNAIFKIKTDANGYTIKDEDGRITEVSKVYSKMAGFNNSNMFVVDEYLYFTSPNVHKENKTGNDKFDLTTLFRVKLDGSDLKEILTTKTSQGKFFVANWSEPYLLIFDNNEISKLTLEANLKSPKVLVSNVQDVVFPSEYGQVTRLFYTTDLNENDKASGLEGNYLYKLNLAQEESVKIGKSATQKITLVAFENNTLYYKLQDETGFAPYYSSKLDNGFESDEIQWTVLGEQDGTDSISDFKVINENNVVYKAESKIFLGTKGQGDLANYSVLVNEDATIELVDGDYVYYSTDTGIYRISYKDKVVQTVALVNNVKSGTMEIAGEYIYFYAKMETDTTGTYYVHRANIKTPGLVSPEQRVECVASVSASDLGASE